MLSPRPHQIVARQSIRAAHGDGAPGFLLGDETGVGKTLPTWLAIADLAEEMDASDILIICPKGAVPVWESTIARSGAPEKGVTIVTYGRTKSLLAPVPDSKKRAARSINREHAKHGSLKRRWPLVIIDEAHRLRNPYAQQSMACRTVTEAADFTVYLSATAGQKPHELSYLSSLLCHASGATDTGLDGFRLLMKRLQIGKAKGKWTNWKWDRNANDLRNMARLLYTGPNAVGLRRRPQDIDGWPETNRALAPTALDREQRRLYDASWRDFRREVGLAGGSTRKPAGWAADLRHRQKASILRIPGTVDFVEDLLDNDQQVGVSVSFLETAAMMGEALTTKGWRVGFITGEAIGDEAEITRIAFQTGQLDVVIFTVTESISLHEGEMPGGEKTRSIVIHDLRYSAIQTRQIEGRGNRDGKAATIYYAFAEGTVEEAIAETMIDRMGAMDTMNGDDTAMVEDLMDEILSLTDAVLDNEAAAAHDEVFSA